MRRGGNGQVVEVADHRGEHRFKLALKRLLVAAPSAKALARFKREIDVMMSIEHPNVQHVVAASLDGATPYYVSRWRERDLAEHMGNASLDDAGVLELYAQICDGVAEAHKRSIVHRDIKPTNILVDGKGKNATPVVSDFGICFVPGEDERETGTQEGMGPKKYMAPELRHGAAAEDEIKPAADVYSLGKVLRYMLAPRAQMFDGENHREEKFEIVRVTGREQLEHVNQLFDVTINRDPAQRLPDAAAVADEARRLIPIVSGHYRIPNADGGQRCQFCGRGRYRPCPATVFSDGGGVPVAYFACDTCNHLQCFVAQQARLQQLRDQSKGTDSPANVAYRAEALFVPPPKRRGR